ncbi:phosphatidylinositol 3- and 4-kinase [Aspergillus flavus]|uniref:Serine/threonine-protein kinase MEC1 n=1 Tax=Aspergillus flavus TaxID=5059 RepID=A0AB74BVU4_ASPFL|nr:protein kinase [Aspergillus flavus]RAQ64436.1 phosphatidylinositol 3- and 4-kinase [Aspergillus flavus]RAQ77197.1 phosphatidylinositol 3- and 4-kinase [Aspergillus flavus]RMZ38568.1 phosphatidylinositol 3- and 4-kinase [Aspergillus flavus]
MATDDIETSRYSAPGNGSWQPPTTLAAQLAPRLPSQGNQTHSLSKETFSLLRQELAGGKHNQLRFNDKVTDISKLICIVLKAGLEPCIKDPNPDSQGQVLDCLDIVLVSIDKAPQTLTEYPDPAVLGESTYAPLYAWLVVRLLQLLGIWNNEVISSKAGSILTSIVRAQNRHSRLWPSCHSTAGLLRACTTEVLLSLENLNSLSLRADSEVKMILPTLKGNLLVDLDRLGLPRSLFEKRFKFVSSSHAFNLTFRLLDSFRAGNDNPPFVASKNSVTRQNVAWVLNGYQRLWTLIFHWFQSPQPDLIENKISASLQFVICIRSCCDQGVSSPSEIELMYGLLRILEDIFAMDKLYQFSSLQSELSQLLDTFTNRIKYTRALFHCLRTTIFPALSGLTKMPCRFQTLETQLQKITIHGFLHNISRISLECDGAKTVSVEPFKVFVSKSGSRFQQHELSSSAIQDDEIIQVSKRRCIPQLSPQSESEDTVLQLITVSLALIGFTSPGGLSDLYPAVVNAFVSLDEQKKCDLLSTLGKIPCAMAGEVEHLTGIAPNGALLCHTPTYYKPQNRRNGHAETNTAAYVEFNLFAASLFCVRRILPPFPSELRQRTADCHWVRHSIIAFICNGLDNKTRRGNFVVILEWLKSLSEKQESSLHETCILTLCRLATLSNDEEMNIILLRLVEYLGHPNPFVCAVAYSEISKLAQRLSVTPAGLFRPFWRTLSVTIMKNFPSRPYMAEHLCDLLGMKVDDFLRLTELYVLPHLVLTRKRDIIARIGATYKDVKTPFDICSEKNNLAAILAFLLSQASSNPQDLAMSALSEIDNAFEGRTLAELVRIEPILIACHLFKGLGDSGDEKRARFYRALQLLAALVPRKSGHASRRTNLIGYFIEEHILGIITEFAHAINDFQIRQPLVEKRRNIIAIGEMVKVAKGHVSSAIPQICACLRSALEIGELCNDAFTVWAVLVNSLHDEDIEPLLDQTLSIVIRYWDMFTEDTRNCAYELVENILRSHSELVQDVYNTMPSLASIPEMSKFESELVDLKGKMDVRSQFLAFVRRCQSENATVVEQALTELVPYLLEHDEFLHRTVLGEQPDPVVAQLIRSLLDCCVKFNTSSDVITLLSARCIGLIGCLDPNRVDSIKEKRDILVLSNFDSMEETFDFILFFLQHVLVEAFLSASNTRAQGFLAYAMQNLLRFCGLDSAVTQRSRDVQADEKYRRWSELPETVRNTLTPFLTSKYTVTVGAVNSSCTYPLFSATLTHGEWLRTFVQDLLQKGSGDNARLVFSVSSRIVKGQDVSIASFLLPFAVLNRIVGGTQKEKEDLLYELTSVLSHPLPDSTNHIYEAILLCSQSIFEILDYLSRWLQGKKKQLNSLRSHNYHAGRSHREACPDSRLDTDASQVKAVESLLASIPPEVISKRAVECRSFSRALFHWEQYIRQSSNKQTDSKGFEPLFQRLQDIYSQIDEPDGIEGISNHLHALNIDQQVLEHRKAGRWATAQSWYELQLEKEPNNVDAQWNLLTCLKESGQQDAILTRFEILQTTDPGSRFVPFAIEASWITGKWEKLRNYLQLYSQQGTGDFNIGVGLALDAIRQGSYSRFGDIICGLRLSVAKSLNANSVASLQSCHDSILRLHALAEMESIAGLDSRSEKDALPKIRAALSRRLDILGGHISDKQYLLGLRRAMMELTCNFPNSDIADAWLASTRLLRKGNFTNQAYQSMLHAARLKNRSATIEHARLLWKDGYHRKAIQTLEGAIAANEFAPDNASDGSDSVYLASNREKHQNLLAARAHLLLAKWTDRAGQTQSDVIVQRYREAIYLHSRWEKAHYYLGKHYNKILDSEKAKPLGKEAQIYLSGEASKLVIDNYLRSLAHGNKYVFQSLPKVLTLWLEHASTVDQPFDPKRGNNEDFKTHTLNQRRKILDDMHSQLKKYVNRMPAALLFTILPQVVARICHPNNTVYDLLTKIVAKAVNFFPQQGLWIVLAVVKSSSKERASRGINCLQKITEVNKKLKTETPSDMRAMINQGQRFSEEMLKLCVARVEKVSRINLARALGFNHKIAPCRLVVPFQAMLTPTLPTSHDAEYLKGFRAFPRDPTTIEAVLDDAQVLNSLQKPRKIGVRGSDGKIYNILCKPKDDLRKDQRLMEFNNMINRFLKRDVESSKRRMYIKTYAVTPLNEECGLIEWVDNLRTLRDIVIKLLRERGIAPNYTEIGHYLEEACSEISKLPLFTTKILPKFPPVLHEWFIEMFPESGTWFAARLRYTRSCAVMSMVGYVLGLGDRHGENILFEEGTGGILHVDFNCLFDKGLTFDKPELVPFRLTQNMVDAFGAYGYDGPFRKTCEITLGLLRQNEDALMTVLETFLHDPTTDFIGKKRRTHVSVPETPAGVLENVRNKLRGLLPGESVPLSVDGHVDELIVQATDEKNLAAMYIGWCAFF